MTVDRGGGLKYLVRPGIISGWFFLCPRICAMVYSSDDLLGQEVEL